MYNQPCITYHYLASHAPAAPHQQLPPCLPPSPPPHSYDSQELGGVPLAAQVMGSNKELLAACAARLVQVMGAPRLDLNCGCPANTVTGALRGAAGHLSWRCCWHMAGTCMERRCCIVLVGVQRSAVQCSAVQCSAVQCSAVQCSAVQCSAVQCSAHIVLREQCWGCTLSHHSITHTYLCTVWHGSAQHPVPCCARQQHAVLCTACCLYTIAWQQHAVLCTACCLYTIAWHHCPSC
jgi:hypothetical protein